MRIAIAGSNGWLGSKIVCEAMSRFGRDNVLCLHRPEADLSRLRNLVPQAQCRTTDCQLDALQEFCPDAVICTTCSYKTNSEYIEESIDANYAYPAKLLIDTLTTNCSVFISISTSLPQDLNLYAFTKAQFSSLGKFLVKQGKISFISFCCEAIYGPDEPPNRFIPSVISKLKANSRLELTKGTQHRDFVWVHDVVDALLFCAAISFHGKHYLEIPMGSGTAPAICEIVSFLKERICSQSELCFGAVPMRENEPDLCADLAVLRSLGYDREPLFWKQGLLNLIGKKG